MKKSVPACFYLTDSVQMDVNHIAKFANLYMLLFPLLSFLVPDQDVDRCRRHTHLWSSVGVYDMFGETVPAAMLSENKRESIQELGFRLFKFCMARY